MCDEGAHIGTSEMIDRPFPIKDVPGTCSASLCTTLDWSLRLMQGADPAPFKATYLLKSSL